jgi:hypothetical protein
MAIFLQSDWEKYPQAIIHTDTKNTSFLNIAAHYRETGVQNHAFMLALLNPKLRDIDPYDPTLTIEQQVMVAAEARDNMWYYLREVVRNPLASTVFTDSKTASIEADVSNIATWWCFGMHMMVALQQIRQTKKSFHTNVLLSWLVNIAMVDATIPLSAKDELMGQIHIAGIREILDELPRYLDMRTPAPITGDSPNELVVGILSNRLQLVIPQVSKKNALNQGRGHTFEVLVADELPYQCNAQHSFPSMIASTYAACERARQEKRPCGIILPMTAGKRDTPEGEFAYQLVNGFAPWSTTFFDSKSPELLERLIRRKAASNQYAVLIKMNHIDLGYTDDWLAERITLSRMRPIEEEREYRNRWTGTPVVNDATVE